MKTYYYSPATGEIIKTNTPAEWMGETDIAPPAFDAQTQGVFFQGGAWVVVDAALPAFTAIVERAKEQVRNLRRPAFYTLAGMQSEALANGDTTTAKAIAVIQAKLRGLPDIDLTTCKTADDVTAAFTSAWMAIAAAAPQNVASVFNAVQA